MDVSEGRQRRGEWAVNVANLARSENVVAPIGLRKNTIYGVKCDFKHYL
jgi:hypothetical protein